MDKKQKIFAVGAIALACCIAMLGAGSFGNLSSSSIWVDNGDGTGYWSFVEEPIDNYPPVVIDSNAKTNPQSKSDSLIKLEQELQDLETSRIDLQKKRDEADAALNGPNGTQTKINQLTANLDLYVCTKKAAYKDKGYVYKSAIDAEMRVKALSSFISKYPESLAKLNAEFKKIPAKNTVDVQNKKNEIEALRKQKTAADEEKKAITDSTKVCITPAKTQIPQLEKTAKAQKSSLDGAQNALNKNQQQKDENKKKQEGERNKSNGGNNSGQGNQNGRDNTDKSSTTFQCPLGTLNYATVGGIDAFTVSSYRQANAGGVMKWSVSYYENSTNGEKTFGPLDSREEAIAKGEEIACGGRINTSSCYIEIANSLELKISNKYPHLCSDSSNAECMTKCENLKSGYLQSINDCKPYFGLDILNPNQNWSAIERQLDIFVSICREDCNESTVTCEAKCGDKLIQRDKGEECDDGNTDNMDDCSQGCKLSKCGDGIVHYNRGELCDDGNTENNDGCNSECRREECGDGIIHLGNDEKCDDGNMTRGDGCDDKCQIE